MKIPLTAERPREPNTMPTPAIAKAAEEIAQERLRALPLFVLEYLAPMQCMSAERAELVRRLNENIPVPAQNHL